MIALLRGVLVEKHPNQAIVDTGGVGYDVTIPVSTFTPLPEAGAEVRLRMHTQIAAAHFSLGLTRLRLRPTRYISTGSEDRA